MSSSLPAEIAHLFASLRAGPRLLQLAGVWLALGLAASMQESVQGAWWSIGAAVVALCASELWFLRRTPALTVSRSMPTVLSLGEWHDVTLRIDNHGQRALSLTVHDHCPQVFEVIGQPVTVRIERGGWVQCTYRCRPRRRGAVSFGQTELLVRGPAQVLARTVRLGDERSVSVYPNFRAVARHGLMGFSQHGAMAGVHLRRRRGHGLEFHQLREFRDGDSLRQVDWKSVSRRRQLVSREYREERNQRVVFVLDCGRRMHALDGELSLLDRSLNALLLLAYVALQQGDSVGVLTFSGSSRWLPPVGGTRAMQSILRTVHDLESTTAPSDFEEAARTLSARQPRRALVVLLTNLRDDDSEELPRLLATLRRKHLVLVASLRDPALDEVLARSVSGFSDALTRAATADYLSRRDAAHNLLHGRGLSLLDVQPADLPRALVRRYVDIKRAGQL